MEARKKQEMLGGNRLGEGNAWPKGNARNRQGKKVAIGGGVKGEKSGQGASL